MKFLVLIFSILSLAVAKEDSKQSKRGLLDLGYGLQSHGDGLIGDHVGLSLGADLSHLDYAPAPIIKSYAAPTILKSYAAPALSLGHARALTYASPALSLDHAPALSYGAPLPVSHGLSYAAPAPILKTYAPSLSLAPLTKSYVAPALSYAAPLSLPKLSLPSLSYASHAPILSKSYLPTLSYAAPAPLISKSVSYSVPAPSYSAPLSLGLGHGKLW